MGDFPVVDQALADLADGERQWAAAGLARRRELLEQVHELVGAHAGDWVSAACEYKNLPASSRFAGEEWMSGPYGVLTGAAALIESIRALEAGRSPVDGYPLRTGPGGRVVVDVLPHTAYDRLLLSGFSGSVWLKPGVTPDQVRSRAGLGLLRPSDTHGIGAVLGAGNITSIPVLDVFYELYAHNRVALLKLNPITDVMRDVFESTLAPLINAGVLRVITGGADVGGYLVRHPSVSHVHLTGSAATHDAIVWGGGEDGAARRAAGTPLLDKPVTSELGGVSPVIVLPGQWSAADLRFQAEHVATQRLHNGGYNCIASQILVLSGDWPQKSQFLEELRSVFASAPARSSYYPGSDARVESACAAYPSAERLGERVLITGLSAAGDVAALTTEYFAPVLGVLELPGKGFLSAAVAAVNDGLAGTLGANVVASPATLRAAGPAFDEAIAALHYGTVAVNTWTALGFLTPTATWGAFEGHTLADVGSGIGVVHNALLLDDVERTVVRGPFRPSPRAVLGGELSLSPRPPWFVTNKTAARTGELLTSFAARPRMSVLPRIFASAMRG